MAIDPNLITTIRADELAPAAFNVDDIIVHASGTTLYRGTIAELIAFIAPLVSAMQFEVKRLHVNNQYILDNFDLTPGPTMGLGINLMAGFAICNGNNGTTNIDGMVGIAYGTINNVIGQFGGETTHVLTIGEMPAHSHVINEVYNENTAGTKVGSGGGTLEAVGTQNTSSVGSGTAHNNMQPYIVELTIMKL